MKTFESHISEQLAAYLDGVLTAREKEDVEQHLVSCTECQSELQLVRAGMKAMTALPLLEPPETVWTGIVSELERRKRRQRRQWLAAAAAVLAAFGVGVWQWSRPAWDLVSVKGHVAVGRWLETGSEGSARVRIGEIGHVDVKALTRLRTVRAGANEYRLALERGQIHAKITAPPRLFFVDTAAGTAIDLGCEYDLQCDRAGSGYLRVTQGWVLYTWKGEESLVPAGASCRTWPGRRPGTPVFDDAAQDFLRAVELFDLENRALAEMLKHARPRDTLTLWHVISRVTVQDREKVLSRAIELTPLPVGISKESIVSLDAEAMRRWREELAWTW